MPEETLSDIIAELQGEADAIQKQLDVMTYVSCPHSLCDACRKLSDDQENLRADLTIRLNEKLETIKRFTVSK